MKSLLAVLILATPLVAAAADNPDASFFKNAAEGGISEVDAGNLAAQKGNSQAVKDYGAMMVKDHTGANDKLKALAATKDITLPTSASMTQMATEAKLKVLSGDTFDKSYIKSQISAHEDTIKLFKKESSTGQDAQAKAFATATLPTLQSHLKKINMIASNAGVSE